MKKITFILFALISGTAFAQSNASETAIVKAEIVEPLTISVDGSLNFGLIAAPKEGDGSQTVTLSPGNVRAILEGMEITGKTATSVPTFTVIKDDSQAYSIVTGSENLSGAGDAIAISEITTSLGEAASYTAESFTVGATLTIPEGQKSGSYEGKVSVTVSYQ